jgi:hypothetical protein
MNSLDTQALIEKLKSLSPEHISAVEDFVDFLHARDEERSTQRAAARASEPSFAKVWDNDEDAAYDKL